MSSNLPQAPVSLATLRKGSRGTVIAVRQDEQCVGDEAQSTVSRRLLELGFVPGEAVEVVEEVWPGRDPIAVRVGNTTFAVRRREAASILVSVARRLRVAVSVDQSGPPASCASRWSACRTAARRRCSIG